VITGRQQYPAMYRTQEAIVVFEPQKGQSLIGAIRAGNFTPFALSWKQALRITTELDLLQFGECLNMED